MSQDWKQKLEALQKKVEQESKGLPVGLVVTCALYVGVYVYVDVDVDVDCCCGVCR